MRNTRLMLDNRENPLNSEIPIYPTSFILSSFSYNSLAITRDILLSAIFVIKLKPLIHKFSRFSIFHQIRKIKISFGNQKTFTVYKCWNQPKCLPVNEWTKTLRFIYTVEYYTTERKKELLPFVTV